MLPDDHLFDPGAAARLLRRSSQPSELTDALAVDRDKTLVMGPDGLPARNVRVHSLDKAHYAHYYADIVGTGMKSAYPGPLVWVELFAGPGLLYVKDMDAFKPGSPLEALGIRNPFNTYVFADLDDRCCDALERRVAGRGHVLRGDANSAALHDRIVSLVPRNALVVLYADPAGLDLKFSTLQFFAERYKHLDLLLNFPVPGIDRALSAGHDEKAAEVLNHPSPLELIGAGSGKPGTSLRNWFQSQLGCFGYDKFEAVPIKLATKNVALYDLMLASRQGKAKQFFQEAIKRGPGGQYAMTFGV